MVSMNSGSGKEREKEMEGDRVKETGSGAEGKGFVLSNFSENARQILELGNLINEETVIAISKPMRTFILMVLSDLCLRKELDEETRKKLRELFDRLYGLFKVKGYNKMLAEQFNHAVFGSPMFTTTFNNIKEMARNADPKDVPKIRKTINDFRGLGVENFNKYLDEIDKILDSREGVEDEHA